MSNKYYPQLNEQPEDGDLKVWWIPQVPMQSFNISVSSPEEGKKLLDTLAYYDLFQFENNVKPNYSNAGGLVIYDEEYGDWTDWHDEETGDDIDMFELIDGKLIHQYDLE